MSTPLMDAWRFVMWDQQNANGELSLLGTLLSHHNEHPYGLPGLLYTLITRVTGEALWALSVLSVCVMCAASALIYSTAKKESVPTVGAAAAALICLSTRGIENNLYGFQIGFSLTILFGVIAVISSRSEHRSSRAIMVTALIAGGFCSATFIAAYLATMVAAFSTRLADRKMRTAIACGLLIAWIGYFLPTIMSSTTPPPSLWGRVYGLLILAGSPIYFDRFGCAIIGAIILGAFGYLFIKNRQSTLSYVGLFSLLMIGTVAFGRGDFGGLNPSRYSTFGVPLVATTIAMACRQWKHFSVPALSLVGLSLVLCAPYAYLQAKSARSQEKLCSAIVAQSEILSDRELTPMLPVKAVILRPLIARFKETSYSGSKDHDSHDKQLRLVSEFDGSGKPVTIDNGKYVVAGRGHAFIRKACSACALRATLSNVSIAGFSSDEKANLGFLYWNKHNQIIRNDSYPLEQTQAKATWYSYAPDDAAYVDIYVYSPHPEEKVEFDSLGVERM